MRALLSPKTLFPVLLLASPGLGQIGADCSTAAIIPPCGGSITLPLTSSPPGTPCGGLFSSWARFTPSRSGPVTLINFDGLDGKLAVYTGDCGSLNLIQCGPATALAPQIINAVEGTTYYLQGAAFGSMPRIYVGVADPNCVANDTSECLQAQPISSCGGESYFYDTTLGVETPNGCGGPPGLVSQSVWYEIVPSVDGELELDAVIQGGGGVDVLISIFSGDCSNLVALECEGALAGGASAPVLAGNRYTIRLSTVFPGATFGELIVHPIGGMTGPCSPCTDCDADGFDMGIDCDDGRASVYPGAPEIMGDGIDNDCDGIVDNCTDCDGDGYAAPQDCDDTNPNVNPGMPEIPGNGIDDDCDGAIDEPGFQLPSPITSPLRRY